jgi:hypothetical protein
MLLLPTLLDSYQTLFDKLAGHKLMMRTNLSFKVFKDLGDGWKLYTLDPSTLSSQTTTNDLYIHEVSTFLIL